MSDGDTAWMGLNMEASPGSLPQGYYARGENVRCDDGRIRSRGGHLMTTFTNRVVYSHNPQPLGTVYGACTFSDPNGTQTGAVLVCQDNAYLLYPGLAPQVLTYPTGMTITNLVHVFQDFDDVWIMRGEDLEPIRWNTTKGSAVMEMATAEDSGGTPSTYPFPYADFGGSFDNRLYASKGKDELFISNILEPTHFASGGQFYINAGSDDRLVNAVPFSQGRLVVFKNQSIYVLSTAASLADWSNTLLTSDVGLLARDAAVSVGADLYFLAEDGVRSLNQVDDTRFEAVAEPLSKSIQPIIDNINPAAAGNAQMTYIDNRLFLALPTGNDTLNKSVLVYNFSNKAWESIDNSEFDVAKWLKLDYSGRKQLFGVTSDGRVFAYDYDWECADYEDTTTTNPVTTMFETRGYTENTLGPKRRVSGEVAIASWAPALTISTVTDGVNESHDSLVNHTKSRVSYETFNRTDWDPTNDNDDFNTPYREDYSVAPGNTGIYLKDGILPQQMQEFSYGWSSRGLGRAARVRIKNTSGRIEVRGTSLTQRPLNRRRVHI